MYTAEAEEILTIEELREELAPEDDDDPRTFRSMMICRACGDVHHCNEGEGADG